MQDIELAALLCSRLCHDLVSPVGALANGIEILADEQDSDMRDEVLKLLEQSARQTSNRLQFFRMAFGAGGGLGQMVGLRDAEAATLAYFEGSRVNIAWMPHVVELPKEALKLLLNLILVAGETIIRDGRLCVMAANGQDGLKLEVKAEAERLVISELMTRALKGEADFAELDPKSAPAYLVSSAAKTLGGLLMMDLQPGLAYSFQLQLPLR